MTDRHVTAAINHQGGGGRILVGNWNNDPGMEDPEVDHPANARPPNSWQGSVEILTQWVIEEESMELVVPELEISGPEPQTTLIGEETTLTVRIPNPFSTKPLTGVRLHAEGRRCVSATIRTSAHWLTPPL